MRVKSLLLGGLAATMAFGLLASAPPSADAQDKRVRWKMASTYPGSLTQLGTLGKSLEEKVGAISGGNISLKFFEPGALVPALQVFDAVSEGSVDAGWSTPGYWTGKDVAFAVYSAIPFGPAGPEYIAWIYHGGGHELLDKLYAGYGIKSLICGIIAPEASGWFREPITSIDQLAGLKMRFFGLGAKVMEKIGVSTQLLAGGDIYPALERGSIDATEFSQPAIDLKLGFYQVAKHYYFPGWHQQSTTFELMMNKEKWDNLSDTQRAQITIACGDNIREGMAEGEAIQGKALAELKSKGVTIHQWPQSVLDTLETKWGEVVEEQIAASPAFKEAWDSLTTFRAEFAAWKELGYLK